MLFSLFTPKQLPVLLKQLGLHFFHFQSLLVVIAAKKQLVKNVALSWLLAFLILYESVLCQGKDQFDLEEA